MGLATNHDKDRAVAAPFRRLLGARVVAVPGIDTDVLGTFSGDVPRPVPPSEVTDMKARLAFDYMDVECALASEGSYGPIVALPLLPSGIEILVFIDRKRGSHVVETLSTHRTNWRMLRFRPGDAAIAGAVKALGFPTYGVVILRNDRQGDVVKDLRCVEDVVAAVGEVAVRSADGVAIIIPDMRAHRNPTRMKVIRALAWRMAKRLLRLCPVCGAPGYGHIDARRGLPCEACGEPTQWVHFEVDGCSACGRAEALPRRDGKRVASSLSCVSCRG